MTAPEDAELLRGAARDVRRHRPRDISTDALAEALDRAVEAAEAGGVDALRAVTTELARVEVAYSTLQRASLEWAEADDAELEHDDTRAEALARFGAACERLRGLVTPALEG